MIIRRAKPEELDSLLAIYATAKRFMEQHGNTKQWTGNDETTRERLEGFLQNGQLFVGEEDGVLHFSFAYIQGEDETYGVIDGGAWLNDEPYGTIHRLGSAGTAKGVLKFITGWALERCPNVRLDTHHDNTVMQGAAENAGYTRCGIIYLPDGDPRIAYHLVREKE